MEKGRSRRLANITEGCTVTLEELAAAFVALKTETEAKTAELEVSLAERDGEIDRLKAHSSRLLAEKKKLKGKAKASDEDDEDAEHDDTPEARKTKATADKLAALEAKLAETETRRTKAATDAALKDALGVANIAPQFRNAVEALFRARKVDFVNDEVRIDGKPVAEAVTEWAKSDGGKVFISAPASGGSGPSGNAPRNITGEVLSRSKMNAAQKGAYAREHGHEAYQSLPA